MTKNKTHLMIIIILTALFLFTVGYSAWVIINVKDSPNPLEYNYRDIVINAFKDQSGDYNKNPQGPTPKYKGTDNAELIDSTNFSYKYRKNGTEDDYIDGLPKDAGTYDILIDSSYFAESDEDVIVQYTINKISPVIKQDGYLLTTYVSQTWSLEDAFELDSEYEGSIIEDQIVYKDKNGNILDSKPSNYEGSPYSAEVVFSESGNFKSDTITVDIVIMDVNNVEPDLIEIDVINSPEYTGEKITLSKENIEVKIGGSIIGSDCFNIIGHGENINAGENSGSVTIELTNGYSGGTTGTFTILPRELKPMPLEIDYNSDNRTFAKIVSNQILIAENGLMLCGVNDSTITMSAVGMVSILNMHNGQYGYGSFAVGETTYELTTNVVGSTYLVKVQYISDNSNYVINTKDSSFILKYKTAFTTIEGVPSWCTIEDAINLGTGTITLAGNSSGAATYVQTAFSKLNNKDTGYNTTFELDGRALVAPWDNSLETNLNSDLTIENENSNSIKGIGKDYRTTGYVYSALNIHENITINVKNNSTFAAAAYIGFNQNTSTTLACQRGVIINLGTINVDSSSFVVAYGFIKGGKTSSGLSKGVINVDDGGVIYDCLNIYDWVGGSNATSLYNKVFLTNSWTAHHLSCKTVINAGATYKGFAHMLMSVPSIMQGLFGDVVATKSWSTIVGPQGDSNSIFKPLTSDSAIIKEVTAAKCWDNDSAGTIALYSITGMNTYIGQRDKYTLQGSYADANFKLDVSVLGQTVSIVTSTDKGLPLAYMDIVLDKNSTLKLEHSDYVAFPGCEILISEGASVTLGSAVDLTMLDWETTSQLNFGTHGSGRLAIDREDAVLIVNGSITGGSLGGLIKSEKDGNSLTINKNSSTYLVLKSLDKEVSATLFAEGPLYTNGYSYSIELLNNTTYYSIHNAWCLANGSLIYDVNGGVEQSIPNTAITIVNGQSIGFTITENALTTIVPVRTGYDFMGWYLDKECTPENSAINKVVYSNTILYAKWETASFTLTYDFNDGITESVIQFYKYLDNITPINNPTSDGKFFKGWDINDDGNTDSLPTTMPAENIIAVAIWADEQYIVKLYNGDEVKKTYEVSKGNSIELIDLTLTGFRFNGWYTASSGGEKVGDAGSLYEPTSSINLYAQWIPVYIVTYNANGGSVETVQEIIDVGNSTTLVTPTRTGYRFNGWYTASSGGEKVGDAGATYKPSGDITLYAQWTGYTITYDANTGTCTTSTQTYAGTALKLPTPTKDGHTFKGWYTAASGGSKVGDAGTTYTPSEDITLYAQWITNYTVTYNANGGSVSQTSAKYTGTPLTLPTPTRSGYDFKGWYTATSGGTKIGNGGASYTPTADITLYAQWTEKSCLVEGTLIMMSDGTYKKVEDLVYGDQVLVFNHETGKLEVSTLIFNAHKDEPISTQNVMNLHFSNGVILRIVAHHGIFDLTLNEYVEISSNNVEQFIGHEFYYVSYVNGEYISEKIILKDYVITEEYIKVYSPITANEINCIAEGLLTAPGLYNRLMNIFEYDDNMIIDIVKKQEDIEKYGLYDYSVFEEYVSYEIYQAFNGQYFKVAVEKGIITLEEIIQIILDFNIKDSTGIK